MLDSLHVWAEPVIVSIGGEEQEVVAPAQARTMLLLDWPGERTAKHKAASETCLAAMEGADVGPAYLAFIDAAIEAGIFVK